MSPQKHTIWRLHPAIKPAVEAVLTHWPAILTIQLAALGIVLSYYCIPATAELFIAVARFKAEGGLFFSATATIISGGVIPELIKRVFRPKDLPKPQLGELGHQFTMWGLLGILVDLFYRLQSSLFGDGTDPLTLLMKVSFDQFVFTPFVSLPFICLWFILREVHYQPRSFIGSLRFHTIRKRVIPLWASCLCFWPIMLCIIYSLPSVLQFPLFLLGNAAYSILMIFILRRQN